MSKEDEVTIITSMGHATFCIPKNEAPTTIYLDLYGKSYVIYADGTMEEEGGAK